MIRKIAITLFAIAAALTTTAQQRPTIALSARPHRPIDTVGTYRSDARVVLYSDNTFKMIPTMADSWAATELYRTHWDTVQIFAYRDIDVKDIAEETEVRLIDDLDGFHCPAMGRILSKYGPRGRRNHNGMDIGLKLGDPIYATFSGRVRYAKYNTGGFGNLVILRHPNGLETYYGHLSRCNVTAGDWIVAGQVIGYAGTTGRSRGVHLHFEVRYCDQTFDPEHIVDFSTGNLRYQTFFLERAYFNIRSRATEGLEDDESLIDPSALLAKADSDSISASIIAQAEHKEQQKAVTTSTSTSTKGALYHTVRSGDTLYGIAKRNGTTVSAICKLNGISTKTTLKIGRKIRVR